MINYSMELLNNAIEEIRQLSAMQVTPVRNVDLEQLVRTMLHDLRESTQVQAELVSHLPGNELTDDMKVAIYRILQEHVANIIKHAAATRVQVTIETSGNTVLVQVIDNGRGFDPESKRNGIGITNMINQAEFFNGKIDIFSQPGHGCRIRTNIPIDHRFDNQ